MATVEAPALEAAPQPDQEATPPIDASPPHTAQPQQDGNPTPISQASLDSAVGEGESLTEAAARVRQITQAAYGIITNLLGGETIPANTSIGEVLKSIRAKNPGKTFQDSELIHEIALALEEAKILSQEKPLLPTGRESTLPDESIEEISARIKTAWTGDGKSRGAVQLLIAAAEGNVWDESQENYYGVAGRLKYIDVVIGEAEEAVKKKINQAVRKADIIRVNQSQMPMEDEELTEFIIKYKKDHQEELAEIVNKYYEFDRKSGTYTLKIGLDKKPLDTSLFEKISTFSNVPDAMDALRDLAAKTDDKGKPTAEASEAIKILSTLEKYLNAEGNGFEPLTDVEKAGREVVSVTYKLLDALLEPFGQKLEYKDVEVTDEKGNNVTKHRLILDKLTDIDPTCKTGEFGELGSRLSRLAVLTNEYEEMGISKLPEASTARAYLAAMIYDEASQIDINKISSSIHPNLAQEFAELGQHKEILYQYRDELLEKVKVAIYKYYYKGEPFDPEKLKDIPLSGAHLFRILYFANACEGHVGINPKSNDLDIEEPFKSLLDKSKVAGDIFNSDIKAIMYLAGSKQAGVILKDELGFDPDRLKEQPITAYANRVIEGIDNKRPDDKKMTEEEKKGYRAVFEEIQTLGEEAGRGSKFGDWIMRIGMLLMILGPSFMKMFEEGGGTGQQEQQPSG